MYTGAMIANGRGCPVAREVRATLSTFTQPGTTSRITKPAGAGRLRRELVGDGASNERITPDPNCAHGYNSQFYRVANTMAQFGDLMVRPGNEVGEEGRRMSRLHKFKGS